VSDRRAKHCPECGSTDIEFESDSLAESRQIDIQKPDPFPELSGSESRVVSEGESKVESRPVGESVSDIELDKDAPGLFDSSYYSGVSPQKRKRTISDASSGRGDGMSVTTIIRIVLGIIGVIMLLSAFGMFYQAFSGGSIQGFPGMIALVVIGVIFVSIAAGDCICDL
jgi:hypothetical protein